MTTKRQREIVIEFEQVKMIRKRAKTELQLCGECGGIVDFVPLATAARLFEIDSSSLCKFVSDNNIHITAFDDGSVCVASLLEKMQTLKQLRSTGNEALLEA